MDNDYLSKIFEYQHSKKKEQKKNQMTQKIIITSISYALQNCAEGVKKKFEKKIN